MPPNPTNNTSGFDSLFIYGDNDDNVGNHESNVEVIKREDLKRMNDPNCKHENIVRDDSDTIGDNVAWGCQDCGLGTFLPKTVKRII